MGHTSRLGYLALPVIRERKDLGPCLCFIKEKREARRLVSRAWTQRVGSLSGKAAIDSVAICSSRCS